MQLDDKVQTPLNQSTSRKLLRTKAYFVCLFKQTTEFIQHIFYDLVCYSGQQKLIKMSYFHVFFVCFKTHISARLACGANFKVAAFNHITKKVEDNLNFSN